MKKILQNISKWAFIVINVFGALFSMSAIFMFISNIFHIELSLPNIITKSLFLAIGTLIGLFFIGIFVILLGKNRITKITGYFYIFCWLLAVIILLKVLLIDK